MFECKPTVSVIIPVFNRERLIGECLASLQRQSFSDWEAVVVDDGSSDQTLAVVARLSETDDRIAWQRRNERRRGASACRNQAIANSRGEFLVFLDSDDVLDPDALAGRCEMLNRTNEHDFVVRQSKFFSTVPGDSDVIWNTDLCGGNLTDRFFHHDLPWNLCSGMWRRDAVLRIGCFDDSLQRGQDWEFHIRALTHGLSCECSNVVDTFIRRSPEHHSITNVHRDHHPYAEQFDAWIAVSNCLVTKKQLSTRRKTHLFYKLFEVGVYMTLFQGWPVFQSKCAELRRKRTLPGPLTTCLDHSVRLVTRQPFLFFLRLVVPGLRR